MIDCDRIPNTRISLSAWSFGLGKVDETVRGAVEETLNIAIDSPGYGESPADVYLPIMWHRGSDGLRGDPLPLDRADTVYFMLPIFGEDKDEDGPGWKFTISDLVVDLLELHDDNLSDPETQTILTSLRSKLQESVAKLDEAIAKRS